MGQAATPDAGQRLDRWLWCARFFKTRSLAAEAVSGGKVHVDGERAKPARQLRPGQRLRIRRGGEEWEVEVLATAARRGPASEAQTLYSESEASAARREAESLARRLAREQTQPPGAGRPTKRDRRRLTDFRRGGSGET